MASRLEVTVSQLQQAANNINNSANDYHAAANNLKNAADALASTWEGDSQVAFVQEQERAFEWYRKMAEICQQYAKAMQDAAQRYAELDQTGASTINSR